MIEGSNKAKKSGNELPATFADEPHWVVYVDGQDS